MTGVVFLTFVLGTFYRSASLYHPQRRAILHLKSQKRKIKSKDKEKNKIQDDTPPFFDFTTLKSRTVQLLLLSVGVGSFGLNSPIFYLVRCYFILKEAPCKSGSQNELINCLFEIRAKLHLKLNSLRFL